MFITVRVAWAKFNNCRGTSSALRHRAFIWHKILSFLFLLKLRDDLDYWLPVHWHRTLEWVSINLNVFQVAVLHYLLVVMKYTSWILGASGTSGYRPSRCLHPNGESYSSRPTFGNGLLSTTFRIQLEQHKYLPGPSTPLSYCSSHLGCLISKPSYVAMIQHIKFRHATHVTA